jgi:long-chain fatty acid transport protein
VSKSMIKWCLFVFVSSSAWANNFDLYGFGPRASSMGGAMTAEANDFTAVFYNPAMLVERKDANFGLGMQWHHLSADVKTKDRAREIDCKLCTPPDSAGVSVGVLFPLGGKVKNRVALGLGAFTPTSVLVRVNGPDSQLPYWYRYQNNPQRLILNAGIGIKIVEWLNIGVGVQMLANLIGDGANVKVDLFSRQAKVSEINSYLETRVAPVASVFIRPHEILKLGVTYRGEMMLKYEIPAKVDLEGIGVLAFKVDGIAHYSPHSINFGASVNATKDFTISAEGEWQKWSDAPSPYLNLIIDLSGPTLDALGLGNALDVTSAAQKPGFSDTFGGRLGMEYRLTERFAVRGGGFYRPTPVPKQNVKTTNLMDGTAIGASVGLGVNFPDPLEILGSPIQIDIAGQAQFVLPREATKDVVDAVPTYTYSATAFGVNVAVRYDF